MSLGSILRSTQFCVVYRTGGAHNFKWHRSCAMSREEADKACAETQRMGHPAHVQNYAASMSIGLPETFA